MADYRLAHAMAAASHWSPRELAGQLFMLAFPGENPEAAIPMIEEYNLCGCYLSQDNASSFAHARELTAALNRAAWKRNPKAPLLLGVDQEGAWGVLVPESTTGPGNMALGAIPPDRTEEMYRIIGKEMLDAGFTLLYAPCADVNTDPDSPIIGTRSFGENPDEVAAHVAAAVRGAMQAGILATIKHFPGHGSTHVDTHRSIPVVEKSRARLEEEDFLPFRAGIDAGVDAVMTSHILFTALDGEMPATLSPAILRGVLRKEMKFEGIVISDSMNMGAIRKNFSSGEAAILALKAGVDIVMLSEEHYDHSGEYLEKQKATIHAVEEAIISGRLSASEVMEKIGRILSARLRAEHIGEPSSTVVDVKAIEDRIAYEACSLLIDKGDAWPVPDSPNVLYVNATPRSSYARIMNPRGIGPNQAEPGFDAFRRELSRLRPRARFMEHEDFRRGIDGMARLDRIVLLTEDYPLPGEDFDTVAQQSLVKDAIRMAPEKCVVVGLRSPYEVRGYSGLRTYLCAFSSRTCSARAAARALHDGKRGGKSPVGIG
ncbi:MAG: glycoside hydrolase family 3 N-terminal domain-containing protein [Rectinemataceae bacterium]